MRDTALFPVAACRLRWVVVGGLQSSRKHTETEKRGAGGTDMEREKRDRRGRRHKRHRAQR